ncbi:MAG TPA: hypothetical protein VE404_04575, partial [Verrucomicrobiae bacterium]|nr:hypothetical protein [Verrucomicrobiae bacterium]
RARRIAERNSPGSKMSGKEIGTMLLGGLGIIVVGGGVVVIVGGVVVVAGPEILAGGAALGEVLWPKLPDLAPATH